MLTNVPLPPDAIESVFGMLALGASPAAACARLGVDVRGFHAAVEADDGLRERLDRVRDDLSWNVAAVLYQQAMGGNVTAMTNWLKLRPPRDWTTDEHDPTDLVDEVPDEHLGTTADATRTALAAEVAGALPTPGEPTFPGGVPPAAPAGWPPDAG